MGQVSIISTLQGKKAPVHADSHECITMYVCGVTPYDRAHIGHGRCYVVFDLLYRLLRSLGYQVTYCRNVTDIDDKLLHRAEKELGSSYEYPVIAKRFTQLFHDDMQKLGCHTPTYEPRVTDHIPEIIAAVQGLIDRGHAYTVNGSVYFRIHSYPTYGELSGQQLRNMYAGARVEVNEDKEDPLDFALWKSELEGTFWKSPWGWGRPGWHIECSALALRYLGATIDIHGGGMDLIFPHHENERAQSESLTGNCFVKTWVHNAFVRVQQEKMSKSLGNFVTLAQAFERWHPMVLRYYFLIHHYRSPLDFSWDDIAAASKSYVKLITLLHDALVQEQCSIAAIAWDLLSEQEATLIHSCISFLCDDLNVQGMMGILFEQSQMIRTMPIARSVIAGLVRDVLGLDLKPLAEVTVEITPEIRHIMTEREHARSQRDWARADQLRARLERMGVIVKDEKLHQ